MLTKTNFKKYLESPIHLWLFMYRKDLLPQELLVVEGKQIDEGKEIDELSKGLFPDGFAIEGFGIKGFEATKQAIESGKTTLIQPTVMTDELTSRADMLVFNAESKKWNLYEVKSTTSVKRGEGLKRYENHIIDVAFQRICWEKAGIEIDKSYIIYVNKEFIRAGEVRAEFCDGDPSEGFFIKEDVTNDAREMMKEIWADIAGALNALKISGDTDPAVVFKKLCPNGALDFLRKLSPEAVTTLGTTVPEVRGEQICNAPAIKAELQKLVYPLYFFDYETYAPAIPFFDGFHPYQNMPFQYSVHIQENRGGPTTHKYFLAKEKENPIPALLKQMQEDLGEKGSVIVWYETFEKGRNKEMAVMHPEYALFLRAVNKKRMYDLMTIFKERLYRRNEFGKSSSLKVVAPVMVPELSYSELEIQEGMEASNGWFTLVNHTLPKEEEKALYENMLKYCERDTEVMVKILGILEKI
ncbi:MAG: DUF2779 domain-containing protein [Candidatus Jorgensenbacteria bacterium]|nr:DUF2779 domain-containing protein [Candidatus Jorgensenbacteria bacterium]